jgi:hypothetical protein
LLIVLVLGACGGNGPNRSTPPEGRVLEGSLEAPECGGGYAIENASVELRDEKDELIGATSTSADTVPNDIDRCLVTFTIEQVPRAKFYSITVGTHAGPSYSYAEMESFGWDVALSLD